MQSEFQKVIDVVASDPDWKQLALSVAKNNPTAFLEAYRDIAYSHFLPEMKRLVDGDQVVEAIKYVRTQTGWGLKEAKDFVDKYRFGS